MSVTYRDTRLAGLTGKLSKHDTCGRWEVVLFCFSSFLLSACSCLSNYHVISRQADWVGSSDTSKAENHPQKADEGGQGSSNTYSMCLYSHMCTERSGCRVQREGRVWPNPAHPTVSSLFSVSPSFPHFTGLFYPFCSVPIGQAPPCLQ